MTRSEAFARLGMTLVNQQWSWSARNGSIVALTFWQDRFYVENGKMMYAVPPLSEDERSRPGFHEQVRNVDYAIEHSNGVVHAVISRAQDPSADPRKVASSHDAPFAMRIIDFDRETGAFTAVQIVSNNARRRARNRR
jgi:hypothetical protein